MWWKKCNMNAWECKGERNKSVTGGHRDATSRHRSVTRAWLHGLLKCILGHGKVLYIVMTKLMINGIR